MSMDLEQKSTEDSVVMHFNEWFVDEITQYPKELMSEVLSELYLGQEKLPELNGYSQIVFGVVKSKEPFYFKVEYIKQLEEIATFLDIIDVEVDDYLDAINNKQALDTDGKQESNEVKSNRKYSFSIKLDEEY